MGRGAPVRCGPAPRRGPRSGVEGLHGFVRVEAAGRGDLCEHAGRAGRPAAGGHAGPGRAATCCAGAVREHRIRASGVDAGRARGSGPPHRPAGPIVQWWPFPPGPRRRRTLTGSSCVGRRGSRGTLDRVGSARPRPGRLVDGLVGGLAVEHRRQPGDQSEPSVLARQRRRHRSASAAAAWNRPRYHRIRPSTRTPAEVNSISGKRSING